MSTARQHNNQGSAVYIAVLFMSVIILIASGISATVYQQLRFASYSIQSQKALFAADTGLECALYEDYGNGFTDFPLPSDNSGTISTKNSNLTSQGCASNYFVTLDPSSPVVTGLGGTGGGATTTMYVHLASPTDPNADNHPCVAVYVNKYQYGPSSFEVRTTVTAQGYDRANNSSGAITCDAATGQTRRVERTLQATYGGY